MIDLHCHILFDVDDGAPDIETSVEMATLLAAAGFTHIAASPHMGLGPAGDVALALAAQRREVLQQRLRAENIALELLANAEHHVTPEMIERARSQQVVTIGGNSRWLLVELPWQGIPNPEEVLFRLQVLGYKLVLAHPERYTFLELAVCQRLVDRGVKMQLELGSFTRAYGSQAQSRAEFLLERQLAHVLATDLHRPKQADLCIGGALTRLRQRYGPQVLVQGIHTNPAAMVADASGDSIEALTGSDKLS